MGGGVCVFSVVKSLPASMEVEAGCLRLSEWLGTWVKEISQMENHLLAQPPAALRRSGCEQAHIWVVGGEDTLLCLVGSGKSIYQRFNGNFSIRLKYKAPPKLFVCSMASIFLKYAFL